MIEFGDDERAHLIEMRMLTTASDGQEVFVGLTQEETAFYVTYSRHRLLGKDCPQDADRYLELNQKHERARLSIIDAEAQLRMKNPSRH